MTVSELFKRDVIIASLHLTRCPTSCQPLQKRQGNKTLIPARFSFCCVLKVSLLHCINFRFCLCIFISGHLLLLYVYSQDRLTHSSCSRRARFLTKVVYRANSETWEFDWDINQIWQVLKWICVEHCQRFHSLASLVRPADGFLSLKRLIWFWNLWSRVV